MLTQLNAQVRAVQMATVMQELRTLDLVPTKTASVSELRTADRYSLR